MNQTHYRIAGVHNDGCGFTTTISAADEAQARSRFDDHNAVHRPLVSFLIANSHRPGYGMVARYIAQHQHESYEHIMTGGLVSA